MQDSLSRTILDLYRASNESPMSEFQDTAFSLVQSILEFDSGLWIEGTLMSGKPVFSLHARYLFQHPSNLLEGWELSDNHSHEFIRKLLSRSGSTITCAPISSTQDPLALRASRYGIAHAITTSLNDSVSGIYELISFHRSVATRPFDEGERKIKEFLVPHLSEAWRQCRIKGLRHVGQPSRPTDTLIAYVDSRGVLTLTAPGFSEIIRREWPTWRGPTVPAQLWDTYHRGEDHYIGTKTAYRMVWVSGNLVIRARSKVLVDELSAREREVAVLYASGKIYREIAETLALSPATVRNHLHAIYGKLGINNKAALATLLNLYAM